MKTNASQVIVQVINLRREVEMLRLALEQKEAALRAAEADLMSALPVGVPTKVGQFVVEVQERTFTRRSVSWKDEFVRRLGAEAAEAVLEATPPKVWTERKLVIY